MLINVFGKKNKSSTSKQEYKADVYLKDDRKCLENINRRPMESKMFNDQKCQADKVLICGQRNPKWICI